MANLPALKVRRKYTSESGSVRSISERELERRFAAETIRFEGVDGDEQTNTVTYWYCYSEPE